MKTFSLKPVSFILPVLLTASFGAMAHPWFSDPCFQHYVNLAYLCETADLNNDGNMDFVISGDDPNTLNSFIGSGDGSFAHIALSTIYVRHLSLCNLNSDEYPDAVISSSGVNNMLRVYLGNGSGGFSTSQQFSVSHYSMNTGDLNGDGYSDLILATYNPLSSSTSYLKVYLCDGDGHFEYDSVYACEQYFIADLAYVPGDLNGDGYQDVAFALSHAMRLGIMLGNGDGTLQPASYYINSNEPCTDWACIAPGDFNEDGVIDLATTSGGTYAPQLVCVGDGNGGFTASDSVSGGYMWLLTRDFNLDGHLDLGHSTPSLLRTNQGNGDGTFGNVATLGESSGQLASADLDNDGDFDIVRICDDTVYVHLNTTITTGIEQEESSEQPVLSLLRCPVISSASVSVTLSEPASCRVSAFSINGRQIDTILDGSLPSGTTELQWSTEHLSPGCYFLKLDTETGESAAIRCLVVD